jgi:hypothetical protein
LLPPSWFDFSCGYGALVELLFFMQHWAGRDGTHRRPPDAGVGPRRLMLFIQLFDLSELHTSLSMLPQLTKEPHSVKRSWMKIM